jgi:HAD superfamily hydrolase (TIGR01662 family)
MPPDAVAFDIVIPTVGRDSLAVLITELDRGIGPAPRRVVVVDDRAHRPDPLELPATVTLPTPEVVVTGGIGPAGARNAGWRRCSAPWVAFLDDDVVPTASWRADLAVDLAAASPTVAAIQGRVHVPLPDHRRPTDHERNVSGLERAAWITADMVVRRRTLLAVGGFDERLTRAYREDTDLALRVRAAGGLIATGCRRVSHPVGPSSWSASVRAQRGNADDALMRRLHGADWRQRGRAPRGTLRDHAFTSGLAVLTVAAAGTRRTRLATTTGVFVAARLLQFWWRRARPGPVSATEWLRLAASSALIPFAATFWAAWGWVRARRTSPRAAGPAATGGPDLVLFDRDGTLIVDVPYNGDPELVRPVPGAPEALDRLRERGIPIGMITNQSGIGRGLLERAQVDSVNRRVEELLGPFATVQVCPHGPDVGCTCRKPAPGMIDAAATALGVDPGRCAVVGDIGADVAAALAAGARAVLVPTPVTRAEEIEAAPEVAEGIEAAVDLLLADTAAATPGAGRAVNRREAS